MIREQGPPGQGAFLPIRQTCERAAHLRAEATALQAEARRLRQDAAEAPWYPAAKTRLCHKLIAVIAQTEEKLARLQQQCPAYGAERAQGAANGPNGLGPAELRQQLWTQLDQLTWATLMYTWGTCSQELPADEELPLERIRRAIECAQALQFAIELKSSPGQRYPRMAHLYALDAAIRRFISVLQLATLENGRSECLRVENRDLLRWLHQRLHTQGNSG